MNVLLGNEVLVSAGHIAAQPEDGAFQTVEGVLCAVLLPGIQS